MRSLCTIMITYAQVRPEKGLLELQQLHDADGLYIYTLLLVIGQEVGIDLDIIMMFCSASETEH